MNNEWYDVDLTYHDGKKVVKRHFEWVRRVFFLGSWLKLVCLDEKVVAYPAAAVKEVISTRIRGSEKVKDGGWDVG